MRDTASDDVGAFTVTAPHRELLDQILDKWSSFRTRFVKVFPKEYRRALGELAAAQKEAAA